MASFSIFDSSSAVFIKIRQNYYKYNEKKLFLLASSAYSYFDYSRYNVFINKTYKWGYFPAVEQYDIDKLMSDKKHNVLMWCGRFIDWKHPELVVELAACLAKERQDFHITMIGGGVF